MQATADEEEVLEDVEAAVDLAVVEVVLDEAVVVANSMINLLKTKV